MLVSPRRTGLRPRVWMSSCACLLGFLAALGSTHMPANAQAGVGREGAEADAPENLWEESRPDDLLIKLVTFGPGDDVFNYFGHNAMIVEDTSQHLARLYNFGMFHFGVDMLPNYLKGKLTFWVGEASVRATYAHYRAANRSVRV